MNKKKKPSNKKKKYFVVFIYGYLVIPCFGAAAESRLMATPGLM